MKARLAFSLDAERSLPGTTTTAFESTPTLVDDKIRSPTHRRSSSLGDIDRRGWHFADGAALCLLPLCYRSVNRSAADRLRVHRQGSLSIRVWRESLILLCILLYSVPLSVLTKYSSHSATPARTSRSGSLRWDMKWWISLRSFEHCAILMSSTGIKKMG